MRSLLDINPRKRFLIGMILFVISCIGGYILLVKNIGFLGGLTAGLLFGLGVGLMLTYKKTN